jgi:hypothetical protein
VLACASDAFYYAYNDLTYSRQAVYRPGSEAFRSSLFAFEERTIARYFPPQPATVLVGAAGGGREAFALARRGYQVVAFEPSRVLAASMARAGDSRIEALIGRYEDLPVVRSLAEPPVTVDLRSRARFDAAVMGWVSFSHLRSDERCMEALRQIGDLTIGPILVSGHPGVGSSIGFSVHMGYYRSFTSAEIGALAERAGLGIIHLDEGDNWPYAVLRAGGDHSCQFG